MIGAYGSAVRLLLKRNNGGYSSSTDIHLIFNKVVCTRLYFIEYYSIAIYVDYKNIYVTQNTNHIISSNHIIQQ